MKIIFHATYWPALVCVLPLLACSSDKKDGAESSAGNGGASASDGGSGNMSAGGTSNVSFAGSAGSAGVNAGCPAYQKSCGGSCIPTALDPKNCGECGKTCAATEVCSGGACTASCLPNLTACAGSCTDTRVDNANCGTCGTACKAGEGCSDGHCKPSVPLGDAGGRCAQGGPAISVGTGSTQQCAGELAQTTFTWALCSCTDITFSASVLTDGYDSTKGPYVPGELGGGVGLNGKFAASVPKVDIGGTLWEASPEGLSQQAQTEVHQELHVGGPLFGRELLVGLDAYVRGDVSGAPGDMSDPAAPYLKVTGKLHLPEGAKVSGKVSHAGAPINEAVVVAPPCDCKAPIPVAEIVRSRKTVNDNASIGLDPGLLNSLSTPERLDLPCGAYYFDAMKLTRALTIVAHGRTAIFVDGDLFTTSPLEITVDVTGELDIFIAGTISSSAHLALGNPNYPALVRTYIGTPLGIPFTGPVTLSGNLYAAASNLVSWSSSEDIYGSVIAGNFISSKPTKIHYDRAVLRSRDSCGDPGDTTTCGSCQDCGNQACVNGKCGACTTSADCCAPLMCVAGTCSVTIR